MACSLAFKSKGWEAKLVVSAYCLTLNKHPLLFNPSEIKKKNQGWERIHQKYKANENTNRHNPKKKQKQTVNKNQVKTLCKEDSWLWNDNPW